MTERVFHNIKVTLEKHFCFIIACFVQEHLVPHLKDDYFGLANIIFHCNESIIMILAQLSRSILFKIKIELKNIYLNKFYYYMSCT